jgi:hypothetical protein
MKKIDFVHVKVGYNEALESKKELLASQINLIRMIRIIKRYNSLRVEELKVKSKVKRRLGIIKAYITRIEKALPKIKTNEVQVSPNKEIIPKKINEKEAKYDSVLEEELRQIQEKLYSLQR